MVERQEQGDRSGKGRRVQGEGRGGARETDSPGASVRRPPPASRAARGPWAPGARALGLPSVIVPTDEDRCAVLRSCPRGGRATQPCTRLCPARTRSTQPLCPAPAVPISALSASGGRGPGRRTALSARPPVPGASYFCSGNPGAGQEGCRGAPGLPAGQVQAEGSLSLPRALLKRTEGKAGPAPTHFTALDPQGAEVCPENSSVSQGGAGLRGWTPWAPRAKWEALGQADTGFVAGSALSPRPQGLGCNSLSLQDGDTTHGCVE